MTPDVRAASKVVAILGPTNTGKTHIAVERMLAHRSGVMGFPLRLLAREIYDRVVAQRGPRGVALVTGEERIGDSDARYVIATVEAMPTNREFHFLAVDEIQLCADDERGHVFTDRLLHSRGTEETMFLGSDIMRPLIKRLIPRAEIVTRPRLSTLSYGGECKVTRLPRRTAVVAFSARDVYAIGEVIRRQRGGAAVVLGSLSPRTRNAQVDLYQEGEVDYLIATDAIGMGLNMDVEHVAFAGLQKFDGKRRRRLHAREVAQIAGRAGRYIKDGTFGVTGGIGQLDEELVDAVEAHRFPPLNQVRWRNGELDLTSLGALQASLDDDPPFPCLQRTRDAQDHRTLSLLAKRPDVRSLATSPETVALLWQAAQIPDYRKTLTEAHVHLVGSIFRHLAAGDGRVPHAWVGQMIARLNRTDGDIDALVNRIAHVRTWSYVSHRGEWLDDALHWQGVAREVEDRLSDALHERLTQRFVDRRTAALIKRLRDDGEMPAFVTAKGDIEVDGHAVGQLAGLRFVAAKTGNQAERRAVAAAARRVAGQALRRRVHRLLDAETIPVKLDDRGALLWDGAPVAELAAGATLLRPELRGLWDETIDGRSADALRRAFQDYVAAERSRVLQPLEDLRAWQRSAKMSAPLRGLAFHLLEGLGSADAEAAEPLVKALGARDRMRLQRLGLRFGVHALYLPKMLRAEPMRWRQLLVGVANPSLDLSCVGTAAMAAGTLDAQQWLALGYRRFRNHALRVDVVERLALALRQGTRDGAQFAPGPDLHTLTGLAIGDLSEVLHELGYRRCSSDPAKQPQFRRANRRRPRPDERRHVVHTRGDGAFAALAALKFNHQKVTG